jgi:hypothetical protein
MLPSEQISIELRMLAREPERVVDALFQLRA